MLNHRSCFLEFTVVVVSRRVELNAVTTVRAVWDTNNLIQLKCWFINIGSPLPRILDSVGEEDVSLGDVPTTLINCRLLSVRCARHAFSKRALAHIMPVLWGQDIWAHYLVWVFTWNLEPTVLSTVLESPWSARAHRIDNCLRNHSRVVVYGVNAGDIVAEVSHSCDNFVLSSLLHFRKSVADIAPVSVLYTLQENVSVVEHPVISPHAFWASACKGCVNNCYFTLIAEFTLLGHVMHILLNHSRAEFSTAKSWGVSLFIEPPKVHDRLNNTRWGPGSNCKVRIALAEPSRESARVASTDYKSLDLVVRVDGTEEKCKIC